MARPVATYRLGFNASFTFKSASAILEYLKDLGISDIYASPVFRAAKGSTHGYDVVNHTEFNPEIGTEADFDELTSKRQKLGLGWVQDIVPNHSAYSSDNCRLMDIFENGKASDYYDFFDIAWDHPYEVIRGRLLAPFLGKFYAESLESGEIKLGYGPEGLSVSYYELKLPLKIESYLTVLTYNIEKLREALGSDNPDYLKLLGVIYIIKNLPEKGEERRQQVLFVKRMLWELYQSGPEVRRFVDLNMSVFHGEPGRAESYNLLDRLLAEQVFRLAYWKVGTEEINYRRFFAINSLICIRVEQDEAFRTVHELVFKLIDEGKITGLRVDHIDGLWDPATYLKRLRERSGGIYTVVEKILGFNEELPRWPVEGTTGYDFLNYVNGLFCDCRNAVRMERTYTGFAGTRPGYDVFVDEKKRLIIRTHMTADIDNLALFIKRISGADRYGNDITLHGLRRGFVEVLTMFPVYRTYISYDSFTERDKSVITGAVEEARRKNPGLRHELDFIERFLMLRFGKARTEQETDEWTRFAMRFQQFTGPLMAKGYEDTVLYGFNRLVSLNEVGSDLSRFGVTTQQFHLFNRHRQSYWPGALNATATHDTKRGEDARARINVLSEMPAEWAAKVKQWHGLNARHKVTAGGMFVPDRNDEYFLYQTLIGFYPCSEREKESFEERLKAYIIKAVREAKIHTEWIKPDTEYENGFVKFVERILGYDDFMTDFLKFHSKICHYGYFNSLSSVLLKITSPGIPDFYQGCELWDLSMVDPDNRRAVDFEMRRRMLDEILGKKNNMAGLVQELLSDMSDGGIKLFTIREALKARRENREVFESGDYIPIRAAGEYARSVIAFARVLGSKWIIAAAPRFMTAVVPEGIMPIGEKWKQTRIELPMSKSPAEYTDVFTGEKRAGGKIMFARDILKSYPLGLLFGEVIC